MGDFARLFGDLSCFCFSTSTYNSSREAWTGCFMGPSSKGQGIFKVPLSCCLVPDFVTSYSSHIRLLLGASACSSLIVRFRAELLLILLLSTCFPFHSYFLSWARGSYYTYHMLYSPDNSHPWIAIFPLFSKHTPEWCFCPIYSICRAQQDYQCNMCIII